MKHDAPCQHIPSPPFSRTHSHACLYIYITTTPPTWTPDRTLEPLEHEFTSRPASRSQKDVSTYVLAFHRGDFGNTYIRTKYATTSIKSRQEISSYNYPAKRPKSMKLHKGISWHFIKAIKSINLIRKPHNGSNKREINLRNLTRKLCSRKHIEFQKKSSYENGTAVKSHEEISWENYSANSTKSHKDISHNVLKKHDISSHKRISWNLLRLKKHDISSGNLVTAQNHEIS